MGYQQTAGVTAGMAAGGEYGDLAQTSAEQTVNTVNSDASTNTSGYQQAPGMTGSVSAGGEYDNLDTVTAVQYSNIAAEDAADAAASAAAAATSATNAAGSATSAAGSATSAETSASAASTSATNAASSATSASNSATTATTQADIATTQATNASASATSASTSAATATTQASNASTSATNAASSASSAATSATNASNSATSASTSATTATTKANEAATSATNADNSAISASGSATTATTQAGIATTQATNAANSASAASASASSASTSATIATTQATNASNSATAAAGSATSAETSATNSANSASAASTSATNAANSATSANTSATNAATSESNASTSASSAATSASTATTQAGIATTQASNASTSATTATTQAGIATTQADTATTQAGIATTQASNASTSASSASASAASAAASYDAFDDRYLGNKTSDPTLDNDGNALLTGALYFNSVINTMKVYTGSVWINTPGIATGGTAGQILAKLSNANYDTQWITLTGTLNYQGSWNASTNTPALASGTGTNGFYYVVSVSGSTNLDGITDWVIGDWAIFNGTVWQKIDNTDASGDVVGPSSSTDNAIARFDSTTGKVIQNSTVTINDNGTLEAVNGISFDTTPTSAPTAEGSLSWNSSDGTLDLVMKGGNVVQQIGEEQYYTVRNQTGSTIANGTPVMANGVTAGSGRITVTPAIANGSIDELRFIGLTTESITNGINGYVTSFGYVRGLDTRGTPYGETWAEGDVIYVSPTTAGYLTNVEPTAPNLKIVVAIVITRNQTSGVLLVRPTAYPHITHLSDVNISSPTSGNLLIYDAPQNRWENADLTASTGISVTNGAGSITITNSAPDQTVALTGAGTTSISGTYPNFTITSNDAFTGTVTSVTGTSPIASSGGSTPDISLASGYGDTQNPYASKTANYVLAAPNGSAGAPTFRAIVAADIPTLNQNTTGTASNVTGTVATANGGTGLTTATGVLVGAGSSISAVAAGTIGNILQSNGTTWVSASSPGATFPGAGIANSTGTSWGTSYSTTGTGTVVALATSPSLTTPILGTPQSGNFSTGTFTWPTFNQNTTGNAATATTAINLSTNRTNWATNGTITAVVGQLAWKNYNNSHTIFDASASTSPDGTSVNNTNSQVAWSGTYPTLMGWNGANTYGVRVDSARVSDSTSGNAATATTAVTLYGSSNIYISPTNANTLNSGFSQASNGADMWINYRGYNDSFSYFRDFRVGDGKGNQIALFTGSSGNLLLSGSVSAPIFYDSNNTAFYVDPASTSNLVGLTVANTISGSVNGSATFLNSSNYINRTGSSGNANTDFSNTPAGSTRIQGDDASLTNGPGNTWWFYQNMRHSNGSSTWGTQVAWGWEDNANRLATRNIQNGSFGGWVYYLNSSNFTSYIDAPNRAGNPSGYYQVQNWMQFNGNFGIYWPSYYGLHLYPNNGGSYTPLQIDGSKGGYSGAFISHSAVSGMMYDGSGNGGVYREANGRWYFYHNLSNNCTGFGTSTTSSAYGIYVVKGGYFDGRVDGTIFYDANNSGYYLDPTSSQSLRTVGDWRADSAGWTGEFAGKMQYHGNSWYIQFNSNVLFRNSGGANVLNCDSAGNVSVSGSISGPTSFTARAWVNFDGTTGGIRASGNVSSITFHTTGQYSVNFSTAMQDTNYAFIAEAGNASTLQTAGTSYSGGAPTTGSARFCVDNGGGAIQNREYVMAAVFR